MRLLFNIVLKSGNFLPQSLVFLPNVYLKFEFVLTDQISMLVIWRNYTYSRSSIFTKSIWPNINVNYLQQLSIFQIMYFVFSSYPYSRSSILYCNIFMLILQY